MLSILPLGSKTLKSGIDYTVSYKNNKNIGKATVSIKGIGAYNSSVSKTLAINPKKVIKKLKAKKTYYVKVRALKKVSGKTYYVAYTSAKKVKIK